MLHDNLRVFRAYCELSQKQVAEILGIDPDTYRKYEIGTAIPSESEIEKLANIYNVSPDRITGEFDIMEFVNLRQSIDLIGGYLMCKYCCFAIFTMCICIYLCYVMKFPALFPKVQIKNTVYIWLRKFFKNHK